VSNIGYNVIEMSESTSAPRARGPGNAIGPGSPAWWAAQRSAAPGPSRGRPRRSFQRIVATAAELLDDVGVEAFSMRALAQRLDTSTATLYRHVAGKQALMSHVVDELFASIADDEADAATAGGWREAAERGALRFHEALCERPRVLPLLAAQVPIGPNALAVRERAIATLVDRGLTVQLAARAFTTLGHYVIGFAAQQDAPGAPGPDDAARLREYYLALDAGLYPATIAAAEALTTMSTEDELVEGLRFILDGIEAARSGD
jgi:AcrR family transcriptional regulator